MRWLLRALLVILLSSPALALDPGEELPVAAQEAQARELFRELRCMVCQNQSIDDSDAPLARDLRMLVRERVAAGETSSDIRSYLVERYGDFVLLRPPMNAETLLLWLAPVLVLLFGIGGAIVALRRRAVAAPVSQALSPAEQARLDEITHDRD